MLGCQPIRDLHQVDIKTCTKYEIYPFQPPPQPPQERTGEDGGLQKKREENEQRFV
jgi:hypothetical protein